MRRTAFAEGWLLFVIFLLLSTGISRAQDLDNLDDLESLDEDVVTEKPFEAGIDTDKWELSFQIGFMDLAQTLFQADQIVVKWNSKGKMFGDMQVDGQIRVQPTSPDLTELGSPGLARNPRFDSGGFFSIGGQHQRTIHLGQPGGCHSPGDGPRARIAGHVVP